MSVSHFRQLDVWQQAMLLAQQVYRLTAEFPRDERFGLTAQLQRAAVSVPSNIAEGNARQSTRDYARFVSIASGSNAEMQTQLLLAQSLALQPAEAFEPVLELNERVGMMLFKLHQSLSRKMQNESRVPSPESRTPV